MKGLDTNILVRYLMRDDPEQYKKARSFLTSHCSDENPCHITGIVLCELVWVLRATYKKDKSEIISALDKILRTRQFSVSRKEDVHVALRDFKNGKADFSDCLIARLNRSDGCEDTVTFDKNAADLENMLLIYWRRREL